jgi:phosphoglycerate dehydrogenase-like enzyme
MQPPSARPAKPVVVLSTAPQRVQRIFTPCALAQLNSLFDVIDLDEHPEPAALDDVLEDAFAIVGQPDLPRERLLRATKLQAVLNVEGNFFPNVDYQTCFERGIRVLGCAPAYAQAVAEFALGLALDLARGISREDRAFRQGRERYLGDGNADAVLLHGSDIGFIGYGNLGRALHPLLRPFNPTLRIYDPWLPDAALSEIGAIPASLDKTLETSQFLFILAAATNTNGGLIGPEQLDKVPQGGRLILLSRAAVVDYDALLDGISAGRFVAAVDVWPDEPLPADHRARSLDGLVLSPHRAGGIPAAFWKIGDMVLDDLRALHAGIPPVRMQAAAPELVGRYRNRAAGS